jgi:hypothetical protein
MRFQNHSVAKVLYLANYCRDKITEAFAHSARPGDCQVDGVRHKSEKSHGRRVAVDVTRGGKQIGNADLVGRQSIAYRLQYVCSAEPNQRAGWGFSAHSINQNHMVRIRDQTEKREPECPAVLQPDPSRDAILFLNAGERGSAEPIVTKQDIAEPQHKDGYPVSRGLSRRTVAHGLSLFLPGMNL